VELKLSREGSDVALAPDFVPVRQVTVGSDPAVDLPLEDEGFAGRQLRLTRRGEVWWLHDLAPERGVKLNGEALPSGHLVQHQDLLSLGAHELRIELDEAERSAAAALRGAAHPGQDSKGQAHLRLETGEVFSLSRDSFLIGKDASADLQLSGWNAPAQAAVIVRGQEGHRLINLGAKVLHQSKPVELQVELNEGDRIEIKGLYGIFKRGEAPRG
jgi:type III secretion system (T3SS) inner membrane Yop/YscD-like protein